MSAYDWDDVPVVNHHFAVKAGWANVAPQIFGADFPEIHDLGAYPSCAGADPDMFFPDTGNYRQAYWAKRICRSCPLIDQCAEAHMDETFGIWGGMSELERREIRKVRRMKAREELEA